MMRVVHGVCASLALLAFSSAARAVTLHALDYQDQMRDLPKISTPGNPTPLASTCSSTGSQRIAVIVASFPGATTPMASIDYLRDLYLGTPGSPAPSVKDYYQTVSEGKVSFSRVDFFGPYMLPNTFTYSDKDGNITGEELDRYEGALLDVAKKDVHIERYDRLVFVSPSIINAATGKPLAMAAGLSSTDCDQIFSDGRVSKQMGVSWIDSDTRYDGIQPSQIASPSIWNAWSPAQRQAAIEKRKITDMAPLIHELGHTFGLGHANAIEGDDTLPDESTPISCLYYGDLYDVMASSVTAPFDIPHRAYLRWLSPGELKTIRSSGIFRLYPSDSSAPGVLKGLEIPRTKVPGDAPSGDIWVEYRVGTNLYERGGVGLEAAYDGAIVHYTDPKQAYTSMDFHWPNETLILDFDPGAPINGINKNLVLRGSWKDKHSLVGLDVLDTTPKYMDIRVELNP